MGGLVVGGVGNGVGVRVDVNEELKFLGEFKKEIGDGRVRGSVAFERSGWGESGGCERRIEVFVKIQKKN